MITSSLFGKCRKWAAATAPFRSFFIRTEETPNTNSLKFITGHKVMKEGVKEFGSVEDASASPLAKALLSIDGVSSVFYGPDFITVSKDERSKWEHLKPGIFAAVTDQYEMRGEELFTSQDISDREMPTDAPSDTVNAIINIIDTRIRPVVQQDGGDIEYRGFVKGYVRLRMQGACKSCASSAITLRNGIENMLMHYIPEVRGVERVSDPADEVSAREFSKLEGQYPRDEDDHEDPKDEHKAEDLLKTIKPKPRP